MHLKPHFVYENKTIFVYFLTISGIIHLIIIFSTSNLSHFLKPELNFDDSSSKKSNYVIEVDLKTGNQEEESLENEELAQEEVVEEEEYVGEELTKEEEQLFVDTSESVVDEETQADTNKIGEKGSIAKDMYAKDNDINDKPRLESDVEAPGETPDDLATTVTQSSGLPIAVSQNEPVEEVADEPTQELVEEEAAKNLHEVNDSEMLPVVDEVEESDEIKDDKVVQDAKITEVEEASSQVLNDDADEMVEAEDVESTIQESDVAILKAESPEKNEIEVEKEDIKKETENEADSVEEYKETASIPKSIIEGLLEGGGESVAKKKQSQIKASKVQPNNVPAGDDAPFFEDNISNAPVMGAESFNVKKHEYAPYYKHIRDKIRLYWLLQYGTDQSINQVTKDYKPIVVTFKVLASGEIVNVVIVNSAGNELLASKIRLSIRNTTLNTFPEYIDDGHIDVKFSYFFY
ncbi:MAG: hypothetical protein GY777_08300 [Candidatus Brocadiaceae bacterium]|nr:hypothetical protein [Candidatus Brocadiaceae bacterium]